jgi:hypothetical protein
MAHHSSFFSVESPLPKLLFLSTTLFPSLQLLNALLLPLFFRAYFLIKGSPSKLLTSAVGCSYTCFMVSSSSPLSPGVHFKIALFFFPNFLIRIFLHFFGSLLQRHQKQHMVHKSSIRQFISIRLLLFVFHW